LGRRVAAGLAAVAVAHAPALGAYRAADGHVFAIARTESGALRLVDYTTGALLPVPPDATRGARPIPFRVRPASYADGDVHLAGRLLLPEGRGPFPAVVVVPGSVRATRDSYDLWAYFFATHGFAVLSYDKRGVGDSGGRYTWEPSKGNLHNQAADALAGVRWLRTQPGIDKRRIGLSGGSQAGWVIPLAAAQSRDVAFAAIQSGPAMSVGRQRAYARLTHDGALDPPPTDDQIRAALATQPDAGFDPRPYLAELHIPVLWQLGAVDKRMYTPETVADLQALDRASFTVLVYPGGAHSLRETRDGLQSEEVAAREFVPGLFHDLAAWLAQR
jgi:dienelactone hydrolase